MNDVIIIIPTYNEFENIENIIRKIFSLQSNYHLLVIDDNSPDMTFKVVEKLISEFENKLFIKIREAKLGLGSAYVTGFKYALKKGYKHIITMDADLSHNPEDISRLIQNTSHLCIGSRYISGINVVNWPLERIILSYMASLYVRIILGMPVKDPTSGFVCYKAEKLKQLNLDSIKSNGYSFQIEMKFKFFLKKYILKEIPIIFTDRKFGKSKLNGSIIGEAFLEVILMKIRSYFKK